MTMSFKILSGDGVENYCSRMWGMGISDAIFCKIVYMYLLLILIVMQHVSFIIPV